MRIRKVQLINFKRFDDLTIDLGDQPKKIIALVGPNGCGKSSIFDAFEEKQKDFRSRGGSSESEDESYYSKAFYFSDLTKVKNEYHKNESIKIQSDVPNNRFTNISFYIRTCYRFTAKFNVSLISGMQSILELRDEPISTISLDTRLETNYKRLLGNSYSEFIKGNKTGNQVKEELVGKINRILRTILDVEISEFGDPFNHKGRLYFKKENVVNFPYANLSSGEKEVIDIIVDLIVKSNDYNDTVFCIDEPELHLNTSIQKSLLTEIEKLIPENCQLWVATHSIGFLRVLQEELRDKAQVLDFSEKDYFTGSKTIHPIRPTRNNWKRIFGTALDDLVDLISPKQIVYCEGKDKPGPYGAEQGLDAIVYNNIFSEKHNDTLFISSGGNTELDQRSAIAISIFSKIIPDMQIFVLKDRDLSSGELATAKDREMYLKSNPSFHRVLKRFEIENYLFDKEVLKKYCLNNTLPFDETEYDNMVCDIVNKHVKDQIAQIKNICGIKTSINPDHFKINLSEIITPDMNIFSELEECIFEDVN